MDARFTVLFLLSLIWAGTDCSLEVKPNSILVSAEGSVQQDTQDGDLHSVSLGAIREALLSCIEVLPNGHTHRPNEEVIWIQNKRTISTIGAKYRNYGKKKRLLIRDLIPEDSGVYECATISNTTERGRAELWVEPQVVSAPQRQTLVVGAKGIITCSVTDGMRDVDWKKNDHTIAHSNGAGITDATETRYTVLNSGSLQIFNVTEQDSGVYSCTVSNPAGSDSITIEVEAEQEQFPLTASDGCVIQYESDTEFINSTRASYSDTTSNVRNVPIFTQKPPDCIRTMESFDLTLKCSAEGNPKPNITWIRSRKDIITDTDSDHYTLLADGSLKIAALQSSDKGAYTCQVSNVHKTKSTTVRLKVATAEDVCGTVWGEEAINTTSPDDTEQRFKRVVEGEASHIRYWPWQVLIEYSDAVTETIFFQQSEERLCGGALIRPDWLVTAAHCLYSITIGWLSPNHLILRAGVFNRSDTTETYQQKLEVDRIVVRPEYQTGISNANHDIALIKLKRPVKPTSHVGFICLPASRSSDPQVETLCTVTGWGHRMHGAGVSPELLHSAQVPIVSRSQCTSGQAYNRNAVSTNELCAGWRDGGADACQNDSGGPLVCRNPKSGHWVLSGVVNRGIGCGNPHKYGIYARVTHHIGWINSVIS